MRNNYLIFIIVIALLILMSVIYHNITERADVIMNRLSPIISNTDRKQPKKHLIEYASEMIVSIESKCRNFNKVDQQLIDYFKEQLLEKEYKFDINDINELSKIQFNCQLLPDTRKHNPTND